TTGHTAVFGWVAVPVIVVAIPLPIHPSIRRCRVLKICVKINGLPREGAMQAIFAIFQLPIMLLNVFGAIGAVIWLLVIGEWRWVVAGILTIILAPFLLGLALLPSVALGVPAMYFVKRRITILVYFFSLLSSIYIYGLISAWCGGVTFYFMRQSNP